MIIEAIQKIKTEMEAMKDDKAVQKIGNYLIERITGSEDNAIKVMVEGKTIAGSITKMAEQAKAEAVNKRAGRSEVGIVIDDQEGFEIISKYYDLQEALKPGLDISFEDMFEI